MGQNPRQSLRSSVLRGGLTDQLSVKIIQSKNAWKSASKTQPLWSMQSRQLQAQRRQNPLQQIHVVRGMLSTLILYPELDKFVKGFTRKFHSSRQ